MNCTRLTTSIVVASSLTMAVGCTKDWQVQRLGPPTLRLEVAREVRSVLPDQIETTIDADSLAGCRIHTALANMQRDEQSSFTITGIFDGAEETYFQSRESTTYGWKDIAFDIGNKSPRTLRFEVSETGTSRWARPTAFCSVRKEGTRPNVVLVSMDTLRADQLGVYGSQKNLTPRLDAIAREGTIFEHAYSQFPNTYGSHASLFTGLYPRQHGLMSGKDARITPGSATLAAAFAEAGYSTVAFTENAFVGSAYGFDVGFDIFHNGPVGDAFNTFPGEAEITVGRSIGWLKARPPGPFFMFLHTYEVHSPYDPAHDLRSLVLKRRLNPDYTGSYHETFTPWDELKYNAGIKPLEKKDFLQVRTLYDIETAQLDDKLGVFLDALQELGLTENTLLVLTSDHGEEFGEHGLIGHGENLHIQTMRVPLILHAPGLIPVGKRIKRPIGLLDLGPTIGSLSGLGTILEGSPATDYAPLILGEGPVDSDSVISEVNQNITSCPEGLILTRTSAKFSDTPCLVDAVAIRDERYSYIEEKGMGVKLLFDLSNDPTEATDLAADHPDLVERYSSAANRYRAENREGFLKTIPTEVDQMTRDKLRALGYIQ